MTRPSLREVLRERLHNVEQRIRTACARSSRKRDEITLVAVTKSATVEAAAALAELGVRHLGESRPQELWRKRADLPSDIHWHLIGHLQRNKIGRTVPVHLIHSADRLSVILELDQEAARRCISIDILLEVNASREPSKAGFSPEEIPALLPSVCELRHIRVKGLMTMAAPTEHPEACRLTFALLRKLRDKLGATLEAPHQLAHLSMGMSDDFEVAIEEGATLVRIGSALMADLPGAESH